MVIEPAFFEVDVVWWFDVPCEELLVWADPLRALGPRASTGVKAQVKLIAVTRSKVGLEARRMVGSPLRNFVSFQVGKASGWIDPSNCHAESTDDLSKKNEKFVN